MVDFHRALGVDRAVDQAHSAYVRSGDLRHRLGRALVANPDLDGRRNGHALRAVAGDGVRDVVRSVERLLVGPGHEGHRLGARPVRRGEGKGLGSGGEERARRDRNGDGDVGARSGLESHRVGPAGLVGLDKGNRGLRDREADRGVEAAFAYGPGRLEATAAARADGDVVASRTRNERRFGPGAGDVIEPDGLAGDVAGELVLLRGPAGTGVAELPAGDLGIVQIPVVVADEPPASVVVDFHRALGVDRAVDQAHSAYVRSGDLRHRLGRALVANPDLDGRRNGHALRAVAGDGVRDVVRSVESLLVGPGREGHRLDARPVRRGEGKGLGSGGEERARRDRNGDGDVGARSGLESHRVGPAGLVGLDKGNRGLRDREADRGVEAAFAYGPGRLEATAAARANGDVVASRTRNERRFGPGAGEVIEPDGLARDVAGELVLLRGPAGTGVAELPAGDLGIVQIPVVVADEPPASVVVDFHRALGVDRAVDQAHSALVLGDGNRREQSRGQHSYEKGARTDRESHRDLLRTVNRSHIEQLTFLTGNTYQFQPEMMPNCQSKRHGVFGAAWEQGRTPLSGGSERAPNLVPGRSRASMHSAGPGMG